MSQSIDVACGFLGGTIFSVEGGYRVLQHPRPERRFDRIADARWFLAVTWCDRSDTPAGILTHDGQLSFQNQAALALGEIRFLPLEHRRAVFDCSLTLSHWEAGHYPIPHRPHQPGHALEILGIEIDPRYGRVALIKARDDGSE
ncbi:hypothetical protein GS597_17520 [Synechococcales cyanobacterium C]|uniref:Uncharacterized protein n=1 Tax=Petrachloros mirabilis ULC683 TaxID=2781853 RepID=A0A8K2A217_9CYAN|nr:hypothetical protein [Petrachloros mirabilis]NCJ08273.1 hypothetical protein [Petrachloros mirabilis ULC683]